MSNDYGVDVLVVDVGVCDAFDRVVGCQCVGIVCMLVVLLSAVVSMQMYYCCRVVWWYRDVGVNVVMYVMCYVVVVY